MPAKRTTALRRKQRGSILTADDWNALVSEIDRLLNLEGAGGITVSVSPTGISIRGSTKGSSTLWMKVKTADDANGVAVCNLWDGTTAGTIDLLVAAAIPVAAGALVYATEASPDSGVTQVSTGKKAPYIEIVQGNCPSTGVTVLSGTSASWDPHTTNNATAFTVVESVAWDGTNKQLYQLARVVHVNSRGLIYKIDAAVKTVIDTAVDDGCT